MRDVLIADDDAALRQALKLGLEAAGYRVQLAANGREALALQRTRPADVLVTALYRPESDGFEAISGFRQAFPSTAIIAMSGGAQRARGDYLAAATLAGVDATLRKPFPMQALLQAIRSLEQPR